ncbi:hypothetical protein ACF0H5_013562 [Mactra antiquata]
MACDVSLLDGMLDDWDDNDDEDWNDTKWSDPNLDDHSLSHTAGVTSVMDEVQKHEVTVNKETEINSNKGNQEYVKRMLLNDNKAGMTGLDKDKINQVIYEASKGSKFFENERKKEEQMKGRIEEQRKKIQSISDEQLDKGKVEADKLLEDFEQQRDLTRCIVHIDMDAFYAAVEMRDDPTLIDKPMAVGGSDMLSTSNYPARKFGVRAAMPGFIAKKLCPDLVIVPNNFEKYSSVSKEIKSIMGEYDPNFCPMSLDEAYLDLTEHLIKRQSMSDKERTVICRDANYAFSVEHCHCDLNIVSHLFNINEYSKDSLSGHAYSEDDVSTHECLKSNSSTHEYSKDNNLENNKSILNENKISTEGPHEDLSPTCAITSTKGDNLLNKKNCPKCGKLLPPFEFETFGLTDEEALRELRTKIQQKTRLTASAGIAPNMMLAKVCSDKNKPNGQYKIPFTRDDVMNFIKHLPIKKISGIGKVSEAMLNAIDVYTCTDLYNQRGLLYHLYSNISFNYFMRVCIGIGSTTVERDSERKSMSTERTFSEISKPSDMYKKLEELSQSLSEDLKTDQLKGKTISIKIKTVNFQVRTRAHTVRDYTNTYEDIYQSASDLLKTEIKQSAPQPLKLRLMGVRMSNLMPENLCQRKQQNTIIGAFKKMKKIKTESEEKINVDCGHVETIQSIVRSSEILVKETDGCHRNNDTQGIGPTSVADQFNDPTQTGLSSCSDKENYCDAAFSNESCSIHSNSYSNLNEESKNCCSVATEVCKVAMDTDYARHNDSVTKTTMVSSKPVVEEPDRDINGTEGQKQVSLGIVDNVESVGDINRIENEIGMVDKFQYKRDEKKVENANGNVGLKTKDDEVSIVNEMDSIKESTVIIHDDVNKRVTRSGLSSTPISSKKSRKKSGKTRELIQHECPVCCKMVLCKTLQGFNEHVDQCLESGSNFTPQTEKQLSCETPSELSRNSADNESECFKKAENIECNSLNKGDHTMDLEGNTENGNIDKEDNIRRMEDNSPEIEKIKHCVNEKSLHTCNMLPVVYKQTVSKNLVTMDTIPAEDNVECEKGVNLSISKTIASNTDIALKTDDYSKILDDSDISDDDVDKYEDDKIDGGDDVVDDGNDKYGNDNIDCDRESSVDLKTDQKVNVDISCDKRMVLPLPDDNTEEETCSINKPCTVRNTHCTKDDKLQKNDKDHVNTNGIVYDSKIPLFDYNENNADLDYHKIVDRNDFIQYRKTANDYGAFNNAVASTNISEIQTDLGSVTNMNAKCDNKSECNRKVPKSDVDKDNSLNKFTLNDIPSIPSSSTDYYECSKTELSTNIKQVGCNNDEERSAELDDDNDDDDNDCSDKVGSLLVCPVCNIGQRSADLHEFNVHVDTCLSRGAITELIKEQNKAEAASLKRSITTPGSSKPSKRRKTVIPNIQPKSCRSIASFFKTK